MAQSIDFARIKREVPIAKVAEYLGLPSTSKDQIRCECPACGSDNPRGLAITKSVNSYYCHIERRGGDAVGLLAHVRGIGQREAAEIIMRDLMGNSTATASRRAQYRGRRTQEERQVRHDDSPMQPLDHLEADHEAVEALGMTVDEAERLGAGYANRGVLRGLVAIPLRTDNGMLVGYIGVAEGRAGKLHFPNVVPFKRRA